MPFYTNRVTNLGSGWTTGKMWARSTTGWHKSRSLYRKTGVSTWTLEETMDTQSPGYPVLVGHTYDSAAKSTTVTVRMPLDADLAHGTLKYGSAYPMTEGDESYIRTIDDGLTGQNRKPATPGQNLSWTFSPNSYDKDYFVSIWAVDNVGNASDRRRLVVNIPAPVVAPAPPPSTVSKFTYNCVDSVSWDRVNNWWATGYYGNLMVQGGNNNFIGGWFYGGKIRNALSTKTKINKMTIKIQRASSSHGVSTAANVWLVPHVKDSTGTGGLSRAVAPVNVGTLLRGQTKTFNVPSAWWPHFLSGNYRGLGVDFGSATAWTSSNYMLAYGKGTTSGQVYIEAQ